LVAGNFAFGEDLADDIPGIVRAAGPARHDAALAAMNAAADAIRDGHEYECSATIRIDDRANLFTNVAGPMLSHDTAGMDDSVIVDTAIADSYDDGESQCEAEDCGQAAEVATITPRAFTYRHALGEHGHVPVLTDGSVRQS
jgi:hypothetical protein